MRDQKSLRAHDEEILQRYEDQSQQVLQLDRQKKAVAG